MLGRVGHVVAEDLEEPARGAEPGARGVCAPRTSMPSATVPAHCAIDRVPTSHVRYQTSSSMM
ncbi:hypothetical protein ACFQYP_24855 [Nonomuraea antimicrobica]